MKDLITVLDIGTTKISVIIARFDKENFEILLANKYPSSGLKKGKIVDMEAITTSIKKALKDTVETSGLKIKKGFLCISGNDINGTYSKGTTRVKKKIVTHEDIDLSIESATAVNLPSDREIMHILPVEFILDGVGGIKDPTGMKGIRLDVKVYIVTASLPQIENFVTCCEKAGIEIEEVILQSVASSEAVLTNHEKETGVLVADIGGGTTDITVFYDGYLRHIATYGIGGNHITNDLALGLKIPFAEAEKIKSQYGIALPDINFGSLRFKNNNNDVEVIGLDRKPIKVHSSVINEIVYARCEEILGFLKKEIESLTDDISVNSTVLTGGCSLMQGFIPLAEGLLSMPVRMGKPETGIAQMLSDAGMEEDISEQNDSIAEFYSPEFSSSVGSLIYAIKGSFFKEEKHFDGIFGRLKALIKEWL